MPYGSWPALSFLITRPSRVSKKTTRSSRYTVAAANGPAPIQVTPSGLSPTSISCSTFRSFVSTTETVPLSALATSSSAPSGATSSRLFDEPARAVVGKAPATTHPNQQQRARNDMGGLLAAGKTAGRPYLTTGHAGRQRKPAFR